MTVQVDPALHYTDISLALAREAAGVVQRNDNKTGMYWGPGAEALLVELVDFFADRRDAFDRYCELRDRQREAEIDAPPTFEPMSWLETDEGPLRIRDASIAELISECALIPDARRTEALAPIIAWCRATNVNPDKVSILEGAALSATQNAIEVELDTGAYKAGDEFDWHDPEPPELDGRHVRVIGFGATEGTMRVVATGPWEKDPAEREPIGGEGPTSSFMQGSQGPEAIASQAPGRDSTVPDLAPRSPKPRKSKATEPDPF